MLDSYSQLSGNIEYWIYPQTDSGLNNNGQKKNRMVLKFREFRFDYRPPPIQQQQQITYPGQLHHCIERRWWIIIQQLKVADVVAEGVHTPWLIA